MRIEYRYVQVDTEVERVMTDEFCCECEAPASIYFWETNRYGHLEDVPYEYDDDGNLVGYVCPDCVKLLQQAGLLSEGEE